MSKVKEYYSKFIYNVYWRCYYFGGLFTQAMENSIREVEYNAEMKKRGSVLKVNNPTVNHNGKQPFTELFNLD